MPDPIGTHVRQRRVRQAEPSAVPRATTRERSADSSLYPIEGHDEAPKRR